MDELKTKAELKKRAEATGTCDKVRTITLGPYTEVMVGCGKPFDHEGKTHFTRDEIDNAVMTFTWEA